MIQHSHRLLPHIAKRTDAVLKKLELTPDISPAAFIKKHNGNKHRYTSKCTNRDGNQVSFYARLHDNTDAKKKFRTELTYLQAFSHSKSRISQYVPQLYASSASSLGEWCVREYIEAPPLGNEYAAKQAGAPKNTRMFVELFDSLQHIPKKTEVETRDVDFFTRIAKGNLEATSTAFTSSQKKHIGTYLKDSYSTIKKHTNVLVHGDSHAGNLLYDSKKLFLIDWETVHYNLRTTDLAYFYVGLRAHPNFRKKLLRSFEKKIRWEKEFRELFPLSVLFFSLNHLYMLTKNKPKELSIPERKQAIRYAAKLANASVRGYTTLKKV